MIAVDTNLLVYAHRRDSAWHGPARTMLRNLAEGSSPWAVPWPCLHEFFSIVTHPKIFRPPSTPDEALEEIDAWMGSPSHILIGEDQGYWAYLVDFIETAKVKGPLVHDARVAAICRLHGVRELWTADRDYSRFPQLKVKNPLVAG